MFDDIDLHKLLNGGSDKPLAIARLDTTLGQIIGAKDPLVYLTPHTARKQRYKHGDPRHLTVGHYRMVQTTLDGGQVIHRPDTHPRHLEVYYPDTEVFDTRFIAVVKADRPHGRVTLESFRKIEFRRFRSRIQKAHKLGLVVRYLKP